MNNKTPKQDALDDQSAVTEPATKQNNAKNRRNNNNNGLGRNKKVIGKLRKELKQAQKDVRIIEVAKPANKAQLRFRHLILLFSFLLFVVAPSAGIGYYLNAYAADQYASTVGFSVRTEESSSAVEILGGITELSSGSSKDTDILYEFIQSQQLVRHVDDQLDLRTIFSKPENDPVFSFDTDGSIEDLHEYWQRMVKIYYDAGAGLIKLRVTAFDPQDAKNIATEVFNKSTTTINELSAVAREDSIGYARVELETAETRLKQARTALTVFRNTNQVVDPTSDIKGQMGLLNTLQQQLAEALIEKDLLLEVTRAADPRLEQAARKINVIRKRISEERSSFGLPGDGGSSHAFNQLLSEFEALTVDREFAENAYLASRTAYDSAFAEANRKSRYLAAYVQPTLAETARYPERLLVWSLATLFIFLTWTILVLITYSIKDRR